ncbi:MAG TPA: integrase arm-type DNA-binding domain-containing protein [Devosia sp.]|nr:integrase arm-type DNA-binding domain-containing protein [Devosia sp.]
MSKLTKSIVDRAQPKVSPYFIWCSELAGFGVRIYPSGAKSYYADYYNKGRQRNRISIGPHGKLTTEEARKEARIILAGALKGEDAALERRTRRTSLTVAELCDDYLLAARKGLVLGRKRKPKKVSTLDTDEGRIARHIKPLLGRKLVIDLAPADIQKFIWDVTEGKTATIQPSSRKRGKIVVTGGAGTAARTTGLLSGILTYAKNKGVISANPAFGVPRPADNKRQRRLTPAEYRQLGDVLRQADDQIPQAREGIWLIALTGARIGEVEALKWGELQIHRRTAILEDTKAGRSLRPFADPALAVLMRLVPLSNRGYVLRAVRTTDGHYGGLDNAVTRIMARASLPGVTAHTLRHSFASIGNDLGYTESTIGAIIGHGTHTMTADYIHHLDPVLVAAANRISGEVYRQMTE